jgi:segregation and condensation protein B
LDSSRLKQILEAALLAAGRPLAIADLESLFEGDDERPGRDEIRAALGELATDWESGSMALQQVASGYRAQVRAEFEPWLRHLWDEKPPRYSRALLETLAIIAYRQPITRPEIEDIRGVSISTQIMRTLQERDWVRVVGHREAPGKPAMFGTTRQFLDYFNLKSLDQLPPVAEIRDLDSRYPELAFDGSGDDAEAGESAAAREGAADGDSTEPRAEEASPDDVEPSHAVSGQDPIPAGDEPPRDEAVTGDALSDPAHDVDDGQAGHRE